ncbi:MAG: radical SAM protein [Gemmataceae bacterium]
MRGLFEGMMKQRVQLLETVPVGDLLIHEIYRSLQGESAYAGWPCVFVRTAVCDLRCTWCDTPHAFNRGTVFSRSAVLDAALAYDCELVELTGGEPLLQPAVLPLMVDLADAGKKVLLETSGAHAIAGVDPRVHIIMDLKCPDSGEEPRNRLENLDHLKPSDEIKFVVASERDWLWVQQIVRTHQLDQRFACLVSAVFHTVPLSELARWVLESGLRLRMQLQMHKYIWDPLARGV